MRTISIDISENRQVGYRRSCAFTIADLTLEMRVPDTVSDTEMANRFRSSPPFDDCREVDHRRYKGYANHSSVCFLALQSNALRSVSCRVVSPLVVGEQRFKKGNPYSCHLFGSRPTSHFLSHHE